MKNLAIMGIGITAVIIFMGAANNFVFGTIQERKADQASQLQLAIDASLDRVEKSLKALKESN